MLKPYYVELKITAVVMAESVIDAMGEAESQARDILSDSEAVAEEATEIESLEHLARMDNDWDGLCIPYGGDGDTRLGELLPEKAPFKDTKTADMFA